MDWTFPLYDSPGAPNTIQVNAISGETVVVNWAAGDPSIGPTDANAYIFRPLPGSTFLLQALGGTEGGTLYVYESLDPWDVARLAAQGPTPIEYTEPNDDGRYPVHAKITQITVPAGTTLRRSIAIVGPYACFFYNTMDGSATATLVDSDVVRGPSQWKFADTYITLIDSNVRT